MGQVGREKEEVSVWHDYCCRVSIFIFVSSQVDGYLSLPCQVVLQRHYNYTYLGAALMTAHLMYH